MSTYPPNPGQSSNNFGDQLTIETPEQTALDFAVAGIGSRFLALAFDVLIQLLVGIFVGIAGAFAIAGLSTVLPKAGMWSAAILIIFYFLLYFGYYAFFEIIWNGQTPGKRKAGIRVIKDSGRPLTPAESIGRNLMRIVDWMPFFYAIGITSAFLTKGNKRLGDLVVGSMVVRETSLMELKPAWQTSPSPGAPLPAFASPLGAQHLSVEEMTLVESFLTRRSALEPALRFRMADEVLRRFRSKLTLPADNSVSAEKILEALAFERRSSGSYS
jgi:uncharacterized RDD family membrane protein YckC